MTVYRVIWGCQRVPNVSTFYARHHAEQFYRALYLNRTPCIFEEVQS